MKVKGYELRCGDVIRIEYGDYDNFVTVVVDEIVIRTGEYFDLKIVGHYPNSDRPFDCYGKSENYVQIIERGKHE